MTQGSESQERGGHDGEHGIFRPADGDFAVQGHARLLSRDCPWQNKFFRKTPVR